MGNVGNETGNVGFNPRTRVGCEPWLASQTDVLAVSIHAPVWGAKNKLVIY